MTHVIALASDFIQAKFYLQLNLWNATEDKRIT